MSEPQGIEPPAPPPPYPPTRIYDRIARRSYPVVECHPISPLLADATHARWQVVFLLPTGHKHYVWVDDQGYTTAGAFGPQPVEADLSVAEILASFDDKAGGQ